MSKIYVKISDISDIDNVIEYVVYKEDQCKTESDKMAYKAVLNLDICNIQLGKIIANIINK